MLGFIRKKLSNLDGMDQSDETFELQFKNEDLLS